MGGIELRTGTSRFLAQGAFVWYKFVLAAYFAFWAVYWPRVEGFQEQAVHQLTFWTWDVCTGCECSTKKCICFVGGNVQDKALDLKEYHR